MQLMSGSVNYTIDELADKLETSYRSIYRYIDTFRNAGFVVEKVEPNVYRIAEMSSRYPDLDKLVYFSEEEAYIVNSLIDRLDSTNTLKANLHRKLASIYESTSIGDYVDKKSNAANVEAITKAIKDKKKVVLKNYQSGNSGKISDRTVEPFAFTTNYIDIWAWENSSSTNKVFKISRIEEVEILEDNWEAEKKHHRQPTDVFRMSGDNTEHIILKMNTFAKNLLLEEYPLAERDVKRSKDQWILDTFIAKPQGAGRFVMGLCSAITIVEGEGLRQYIKEQTEQYLTNI